MTLTEIDLERIRYNTHPTTAGCFKHQITLAYNAGVTPPLGISFVGAYPLVRARTLSRVDVQATTSCGTTTTLRSYALDYTADTDTGVPGARLKQVVVTGRAGTPEAVTPIRVASYEYAAATVPAMTYEAGPDILFPSEITGTPMFSISTVSGAATSPGGGPTTVRWDDVIDMTGDARPDLVFRRNGQLGIASNRPTSTGTASFTTSATSALSSGVYVNRPLSSSSSTVRRYTLDAQNQQDVWRQVIDVNGDGRMDIIDASEVAGFWVMYLNTPGTAADPVSWRRLPIDVSRLRTELSSRGHVITTGQLPLSRRRTGYDLEVTRCYLNGAERSCRPEEHQPQARTGYEKTFTEWEVRDVNGDGYPDVLFNGGPVTWQKAPAPGAGDNTAVKRQREGFWPAPSTAVLVALNTLGVRIAGTAMFSNPVVMVPASTSPNAEVCGVGLWRGSMEMPDPYADRDRQVQVCGFMEANGDGLIDYLQNFTSVRLGTGVGLSFQYVGLPGALAYRNPRDTVCVPGNATAIYNIEQESALRDLTGDGVPDFIGRVREPGFQNGRWVVWPGTGNGFAQAYQPISGAFALHVANERCDSPGDSHTQRGLYDIDGDGKPEVISMQHSPSRLSVLRLQGLVNRQPGRPDAGRLIAVDNGAGALTTITYRSAKLDPLTDHQVPFPEIVVDRTTTTGSRGLGGTLAETRYAYGGAKLFFDPDLDRFTMRSYLRVVEATGSQKNGLESQFATVREYHDLAPFAVGSSEAVRFHRYQLVGRLRSETRLGYGVAFDPWTVLVTAALGTTKQIAASEQAHASRYVPLGSWSVPDPIDCLDVPYPYDWGASLSSNVGSAYCAARGLTYVSNAKTWTGPGFAVGTQVAVTSVDDRGNVLAARNDGDVFRPDDDTCITQTFAQPATGSRVFHAVATREVNNCKPTGTVIHARDTWEYDTLAVGSVSLGRTTSHSVERRETFTGALLATVRDFAATYDGLGNLATVAAARAEDGALRTVALTYEPWGLVPNVTRVTAGGVPDLVTTRTLDGATLAVTAETDPNGTVRGTVRDGFDRVTQTTLRAPGASPTLITSTASYANFGASSVDPRRVTSTVYAEPVAPGSLATAEGTTVTTELDELGRTRQVREALGADYSGDTLVSQRTYDPLGRLSFASDAHAQSTLPPLLYGTTYHYAGDGELDCEIRGYGVVARTATTNLATEVLPTCVTRTFVGNQLRVTTSTPDALQAGTPQAGVTTVETFAATGRLLQRETQRAGTRLELQQYTHDVFGNTRSLVRYADPAGATLPTTWSWTYDSLGQVLTSAEPEVATRTNTYSSFGELRSVTWSDSSTLPARAMRLEYTYDALGRKLSSVERQDGVTVPNTAYTWSYDTSAGSPHLTSQNAKGRLTKTSSTLGDVLVSYDATGQVSARTYVAEGLAYHERFGNRLDGSLAWLELALPDNAHAPERIDYGYDSAQRLRSIMAGATSLYGATTIDVLGRVRAAELGDNTHYTASYQESGRRLPLSETYELTSGRRRTTLYQSFDAMGRELVRREDIDGAVGTTTTQTYSALGHLATSRDTRVKLGVTSTVALHSFSTDALGNALSAVTTNGTSVTTSERRASHSAVDRDRLCRLDYGPATTGGCNVLHDGAGNIRSYPARGGGARTLTFYPSGPVRSITQGAITANFRYDGSGFLDALDLVGTVDPRTDRRYGLTQRRTVTTAGVTSSILVRSIPGPGGGTIATRRGAAGPWIYPAGDGQGTRRTFNDGTEVLQEISYTPFGVATSTGPAPTANTYTRHQWNGGDALADLGLVILGARVYDPHL